MPIIETEFMEMTRDLDLEAFWAENDQCMAFTTAKPRCPVSFSPDDHWIFEFVAVPSTVRYYFDKPYRDDLHRAVNRITLAYVGKAFFDEDTFAHDPKRIENLFGCEFTYHEGSTPWLTPVTEDPDEFARALDRAVETDLETWALPDAFRQEWKPAAEGKPLPKLGTGSRGPATIMTSVLRPGNGLLLDGGPPHLMRRFRDILAEKMVTFNLVLAPSAATTSRAGGSPTTTARFSPTLYAEYCAPVLHRAGRAAPRRRQPLPTLRQRHGPPARPAVRPGHPRGELRAGSRRGPHPRQDAGRLDPRADAALPPAQRQPGRNPCAWPRISAKPEKAAGWKSRPPVRWRQVRA